jgi:hypothetical protein
VAGTKEGEAVKVEAFATDLEGNQSPLVIATVHPVPTEVNIDSMTEPPPLFDHSSDESNNEVLIESEPTREEGPVAEASIVNEEKLCEGKASNPCGHYNGIDAARYAYAWTFPGLTTTKCENSTTMNSNSLEGMVATAQTL